MRRSAAFARQPYHRTSESRTCTPQQRADRRPLTPRAAAALQEPEPEKRVIEARACGCCAARRSGLTVRAPQVKTSPFDARFPTVNQAKNCYTRYNEFHKCAPAAGATVPRAEGIRPPGAPR